MNLCWWQHSNLAPTLFFLPKNCRSDSLLLYRCAHLLDNIIDETRLPQQEKSLFLNRIEKLFLEKPLSPSTHNKCDSPLYDQGKNCSIDQLQNSWNSLTQLRGRLLARDISPQLFLPIIAGMRIDLEQRKYQSFELLTHYIEKVAGAVAILSLHLFYQATQPHLPLDRPTLDYARELSFGLQLTNIIRDISEDGARGYCYIPSDEREHFGVSYPTLITPSQSTPAKTHLLRYQAERALSYFARAEKTWETLSIKQQQILLPTRIMAAVYLEILKKMEHICFVMAQKCRLTWQEKLLCFIRILPQAMRLQKER